MGRTVPKHVHSETLFIPSFAKQLRTLHPQTHDLWCRERRETHLAIRELRNKNKNIFLNRHLPRRCFHSCLRSTIERYVIDMVHNHYDISFASEVIFIKTRQYGVAKRPPKNLQGEGHLGFQYVCKLSYRSVALPIQTNFI